MSPGGRAMTPDSLPADGRFSPGMRRLLTFGVSGALGAISLVLRITETLSGPTIVRIGAVAWMLVGVLLFGRNLVHFDARYWQFNDPANPLWTARLRRRLNAWMLAESAVAVLIVAGGVWMLLDDELAWSAFAVVTAGALFVWLLISEKLDLAQCAGLDRGTEHARSTGQVEWLRHKLSQLNSVPGVKTLDEAIWVWK